MSPPAGAARAIRAFAQRRAHAAHSEHALEREHGALILADLKKTSSVISDPRQKDADADGGAAVFFFFSR